MQEQKIRHTETALRLGYGLVPIVAGVDKFTNQLVDWDEYLSPAVTRLLPVKASTFMKLVGVVEIAAGALVLTPFKRFGSYLVGGWLAAIAAQVLTSRKHYDVAVRDAVMAMGAFALAKLLEADR